jgi:hypothetical protein
MLKTKLPWHENEECVERLLECSNQVRVLVGWLVVWLVLVLLIVVLVIFFVFVLCLVDWLVGGT